MSSSEERKIISDASLTLWKSGNHVDITIVNHPAHNCLELIVFESSYEKEAPRIYISASKIFPHLDQEEYRRIIDEARNHHHIFTMGSGDKAQEAFEKTASKYLTSRVSINQERNNIDHFEVYLSSHFGDTIDDDHKSDTAIVHGSLPDGHHHLDVVIPQPAGLVPFPIHRAHTTRPTEFFQAVNKFQANTHQAAASNNDALHHLHVVENVVSHLKTFSTADLTYSLPKQRWKRAIRRILFQLLYGKIISKLKKYNKRQKFLSACTDQQTEVDHHHRHQEEFRGSVHLQPLSSEAQHQHSIKPSPPNDLRPSSGVGRLNPVIISRPQSAALSRDASRSTSPVNEPQDFIGEVHHHHYMLNMLEEQDHKLDQLQQQQQVSPPHPTAARGGSLFPGVKSPQHYDAASQAKESASSSYHNLHHLEPLRPIGGSRPPSAAPSRSGSRSGSRVPSRCSSPLHGLPQLGIAHTLHSPDNNGTGSFFPAAHAQAKSSPDAHLTHQARDRYYERYHPEKLQSPQHGAASGSSHSHHQPLPSLSTAAAVVAEDDNEASSTKAHHSSSRIFHK